MNKSKGFTIIELLVVIAIIAVLAAIVLVNVTQYINKGKDAAIKGNMATIMTNAAQFYDTPGTYTGFDAAPGYTVPAAAITSANAAPTLNVSTDDPAGSAYCVEATLKDATVYCVDSTGFKGAVTAADCDAASADCAGD